MSNFLAVDCSSRYLCIAAEKGGKVVTRYIDDCSMNHSVMLMDEIESALSEADLTPNECDFFCAVTGPGSFTGIRIGISTVKGLALGAGKPCYGITSFEEFAYNVNSENFCVVIDAAHGHYYAMGFEKGSFPPAYLDGEQVKSFKELYGFEDLPFENYTRLSPKDCLARAVERAEECGLNECSALYVRKSQAEEGRR